MTATLAHIEVASSYAFCGPEASRPAILRARRSVIRSRSSISATWSVTGAPWPPSTSPASSARVARSEAL